MPPSGRLIGIAETTSSDAFPFPGSVIGVAEICSVPGPPSPGTGTGFTDIPSSDPCMPSSGRLIGIASAPPGSRTPSTAAILSGPRMPPSGKLIGIASAGPLSPGSGIGVADISSAGLCMLPSGTVIGIASAPSGARTPSTASALSGSIMLPSGIGTGRPEISSVPGSLPADGTIPSGAAARDESITVLSSSSTVSACWITCVCSTYASGSVVASSRRWPSPPCWSDDSRTGSDSLLSKYSDMTSLLLCLG